MFKIALIVFRECLEISLLLGVILAVTKQIEKSRLYIIAGVMLGVVWASIFAFFTRKISLSFGGMGDELFDSGVMILITILISWTIIWMQGYGAKVKLHLNNLSERINEGSGSYIMLVLLVASTILREGAEIIILVYSISSVETINSTVYLQGLIIGATSGFLLGLTIYFGLIKLTNQKYIFKISTILLMLIAGGFAANAAGILTSSGLITCLSDQLWDSSWLISDRSMTGNIIHIVTGYIARPNGLQVAAYFCTIILINILIKIKLKYTRFSPQVKE
ncbi:FTR1 family iron permease [Rickettsia endosymbiont of Halotydeus destructor]|uniref:FTR1 family iron permease n=1 Tax=Rickettsia endosymbiont of Halotydeus destructor TaxID=2996754 RepID=UPI003BAEEF81